MKLKIVVVDFEIPMKAKKWAVRAGIPAVILTAAAVAWAAPLHTWNTGDTLQATDLNGNFANLQAQITALQTQVPSAFKAAEWSAGAGTGAPSSGNNVMGSITVTAPATGTVLVIMSGSCAFTGATPDYVVLSIEAANNTQSTNPEHLTKASGASTGPDTIAAVAGQNFFSVTAGPHTYYLIGTSGFGTNECSGVLTATYQASAF